MLLLSMAILFEMLYYSFKRVFLWIIAKMITGFLHAKIMSDSCLVNLLRRKTKVNFSLIF